MKKHEAMLLIASPFIAIATYMLWKYYQYVEYALIILSWLAFAGVIFLCAYMVCMASLKISKRRASVAKEWADVAYRQAEAKRLSQTVTLIKAGDNVVVTHVDYPMQLVTHAAPPLPLADKIATINQIAAPVSEADIMDGVKTGEGWIKDFLFDEYDNVKVFHAKIDGPTGAGKTHLILQIIHLLQYPYPRAEYWLCDPKFEGQKSGWPFTPLVTDFDDAANGANYIYQNVVTKRKHDNRLGVEPSHPAFVVFDEIDGCFDEHKDEFVKPVRRIIKEGRSGWVHCFAVGQSTLAKDIGLSSATLRNMGRFVLGHEATSFTRNPQFSYWPKEFRTNALNQLAYLQERKQRSVLAIPPNGQGLPFVAVIPEMKLPTFNQAAPVSEASKTILSLPPLLPTMDLSSAEPTGDRIAAMIEAYMRGEPLTSVASIGYKGQGDGQNICCLQLLGKHGVTLRQKHVEKLAKHRAKVRV